MKSNIPIRIIKRNNTTKYIKTHNHIDYQTNPNLLFYHFLLYNENIELFENNPSKKFMDLLHRPESIDNFYTLYLKMKKEFIWNNFKFPYIYFKILYYKAKKIKKKIWKYSTNKKIGVLDIFNCYNPIKNLLESKEHNWNIPIEILYKRYYERKIKEAKLKKEKSEQNIFNYFDKTNLLVLVKTNTKSKKLVFEGTLCNIFLQDPDIKHKKENKYIDLTYDFKGTKKQVINLFKNKRIKSKNKTNSYNNDISINSLINRNLSHRNKYASLKKKILNTNFNSINKSMLPKMNSEKRLISSPCNSLFKSKKNINKITLRRSYLNIPKDYKFNIHYLSKNDFFY